MSNALKEWRQEDLHDVTDEQPYGNEWDVFMFGHCLEVYWQVIWTAKLLQIGKIQPQRRILLYLPGLHRVATGKSKQIRPTDSGRVRGSRRTSTAKSSTQSPLYNGLRSHQHRGSKAFVSFGRGKDNEGPRH